MTAENSNIPYRDTVNGYDLLKILAIATMVIDHAGVFFFPDTDGLRVIGRMAFPIFLFLVGYSHQTKVPFTLIIGCLILIAVDAWTFYPIFPINILSTIIVVRLLIAWAEKKDLLALPPAQIFLVLAIWQLLTMFILEYGAVAAMYALVGYYARQPDFDRKKLTALLVFVTIFHITMQAISFEFGAKENILMVAVLVVAAILMLRVSLQPLSLKQPLLRQSIRFVSRNALLVYVVHVALFQITETIFHPGPAEGNPWIRFSN